MRDTANDGFDQRGRASKGVKVRGGVWNIKKLKQHKNESYASGTTIKLRIKCEGPQG